MQTATSASAVSEARVYNEDDEVPTWGHGTLARPSSAPILQRGGGFRSRKLGGTSASGTVVGTLFNEGPGQEPVSSVVTLDMADEHGLSCRLPSGGRHRGTRRVG